MGRQGPCLDPTLPLAVFHSILGWCIIGGKGCAVLYRFGFFIFHNSLLTKAMHGGGSVLLFCSGLCLDGRVSQECLLF